MATCAITSLIQAYVCSWARQLSCDVPEGAEFYAIRRTR